MFGKCLVDTGSYPIRSFSLFLIGALTSLPTYEEEARLHRCGAERDNNDNNDDNNPKATSNSLPTTHLGIGTVVVVAPVIGAALE